jgi:hypothetical protein
MTALPIDLRNAEYIAAVSNTPFFLARRLREDPVIQQAVRISTPQRILDALRSVVMKKPETLTDLAEIYAYLVALSYADDANYLSAATNLKAPHIKWYAEIAAYLNTANRSTTISNIIIPTSAEVRRLSARESDVATTNSVVTIR